ncbi:MAG: hypothetical protein HUU08_14675 [Candidatus Brocadia sp.]|nr:hypothetical protein [Candidatus Brocadia sp.]
MNNRYSTKVLKEGLNITVVKYEYPALTLLKRISFVRDCAAFDSMTFDRIGMYVLWYNIYKFLN